MDVSPYRGLARLAGVDHSPARRLQLLRQAARPQDHGARPRPPARSHRGLQDRSKPPSCIGATTCANPVAAGWERGGECESRSCIDFDNLQEMRESGRVVEPRRACRVRMRSSLDWQSESHSPTKVPQNRDALTTPAPPIDRADCRGGFRGPSGAGRASEPCPIR